jgi:hypothetical protein
MKRKIVIVCAVSGQGTSGPYKWLRFYQQGAERFKAKCLVFGTNKQKPHKNIRLMIAA